MPESRNTTLMELSGRFLAAGEQSIIQRYPDVLHFLVIPPAGTAQPPLMWTSQNQTLTNTTELSQKDKKRLLSTYADGRTVVTPLIKRERNNKPSIIIGRAPDADIRFKDSSISKYHAGVRIDNGKVYIRDLESTNGTSINQHRMMADSRYQVTPGQEITLAETRTAYLDLAHLVDLVKLATER